MSIITLKAQALTQDVFAPYGDVIETEGAEHFSINQGTVERYHDLATIELGDDVPGRALISIVRCNVLAHMPHPLSCIERHPIGSQAFIPMGDTPIVVAVAPPGDKVQPDDIRAFVSNGSQGVNYKAGTWHMPAIFLNRQQQMLVVDRGGAGDNCEERRFPGIEIFLEW